MSGAKGNNRFSRKPRCRDFQLFDDNILRHTWETDESGLLTNIDPYVYELFGVAQPGRNQRITFLSLIPGRERNKISVLFDKRAVLRQVSCRIEQHAGGFIWIEIDGSPFCNDAGNFSGYRGWISNITERILLEEELIRFRTIADKANYGIATASLDNSLIYVNDTLCTMHGYDREELLGKSIFFLNPVQNHDAGNHLLDVMRTRGGFESQEIIHKKKDGTEFPTLTSAKVIYDNDMNPQFLTYTIIDITDRKESETALRISEQRLRYTQDIAKMGSWELNMKTGEVQWSKSYFELIERDPATTVADMKLFTEILHPDDQSLIDQKLEEIISKRVATTFEMRLRMPGGRIKWVKNCIIPEFQNGNLYLLHGVNIDITDLKEAENEIRELNINLEKKIAVRTSELEKANKYLSREIIKRELTEKELSLEKRRLNDILTGTNIGTWEWNIKTGETIFNERWAEIIGYTLAELEPVSINTWIEFSHPDDLSHSNDYLNRHFRKETDYYECEVRMKHKSGSWVWVFDKGRVHEWDEEGRPWLMSGTHQDITEWKTQEEQLFRAKLEAEKANRAKSDFISNMSHEIRTPMNAILGYAELLEKTLENKNQKDYLRSIKSAGMTLLTLINDILDLSRVEAGKMPLQYEYVNTSEFFSSFGDIFAFKVATKKLSYYCEITPEIPSFFFVDNIRLRQIIINLIGNAVKFTDKGSVKLKVHYQNKIPATVQTEFSEGSADLIIEVTDTGPGFSRDFCDIIFQPFTQSETSKYLEGTGLGLTITKQLVLLMNGTIEVISTPGRGSSFIVRIPEIIYREKHDTSQYQKDVNPSDVVFEKATLILADDVADNIRLIKDILQGSMISILEASDGSQAFEIIQSVKPDLAIIDIQMPGMSGFELLEKIRRNDKLNHMPVVAYTASVMKEQKEKIVESGFSDVLVKPLKISDLFSCLISYLPHRILYKDLQPDNKDPYIDKRNIIDPEALLASLEGNFMQTRIALSERQPLAKVKSFGNDLLKLGRSHNCLKLENYGKELAAAADSFNISSMLELLGRYEKLINDLRG